MHILVSAVFLSKNWKENQQESTPVGSILQGWKLYILQFELPPPDVTRSWNSQMNKFEQVSIDHQQMSLAGVVTRSGRGVTYHVTHPMIHLIASPQ